MSKKIGMGKVIIACLITYAVAVTMMIIIPCAIVVACLAAVLLFCATIGMRRFPDSSYLEIGMIAVYFVVLLVLACLADKRFVRKPVGRIYEWFGLPLPWEHGASSMWKDAKSGTKPEDVKTRDGP